MHVHTSEVVISECNSIANNEKPPPPQFDETIPGRVSSFWTHQQGLSRHDQKPKSHICNNMKNLVSIYYKFLRTHHTRSACYHFGTRIPSPDGIFHIFHIIANMGFWFLIMTGQALLMSPKGRNASRDGLVKLWGGGLFIICNTITL